jgi:hypothetical protein
MMYRPGCCAAHEPLVARRLRAELWPTANTYGTYPPILGRPPAVTPPGAAFGSLPVRRNAPAGTTTPMENGLTVTR